MSNCTTGSIVKFCVLFYILFSAGNSYAQRYVNYNDKYAENAVLIELGGGLGVMNCLTDIGGGKGPGKKFIKDINWSNSQLCGSGYLNFTINDAFAVRAEVTFGKVKAYDSILSKIKDNSHGRYYRNLNFQSSITEYAVIGEFHPLLLKDYGDDGPPRFSPYLLAGVAKFSFNPQTYFQNRWVDLQPLHLEGQGFKEYKDRPEYRLTSTSFPVGLGLRYELGSLLFARFEATYRFTTTDYLDDVSQAEYVNPALFNTYLTPAQAALATQLYNRHYEVDPTYQQQPKGEMRGDPKNKDSYFSFCLKLGLILNRRAAK